MFEQVRRLTDSYDVIAFFRARAMMLYTERRAIQNSDLRLVASKADWYVMSKNPDGTPSSYAQYPLTDSEAVRLGFEKVYDNELFSIFRTPRRTPTPVVVPGG
jgi:hypothetical protein